jgi:hypothetical protein
MASLPSRKQTPTLQFALLDAPGYAKIGQVAAEARRFRDAVFLLAAASAAGLGAAHTQWTASGPFSTDTRAQFRRVEIWFVPGGAAMPAGISGLQDVPAADVKKLGCPK